MIKQPQDTSLMAADQVFEGGTTTALRAFCLASVKEKVDASKCSMTRAEVMSRGPNCNGPELDCGATPR